MTDFGRRDGDGDMLKSVYDANDDGVVDNVPAHKTSHQDAGTDEIDAAGLQNRINYVDRGDPAAPDWTEATLTTDGQWHDINCSSVVPAGATAINFRILVADDAIGSNIFLRKKGNTNIRASLVARVQSSGWTDENNGIISCDSDRKCQYRASNVAFMAIHIVILGWFT